jgi:hypothetical protein
MGKDFEKIRVGDEVVEFDHLGFDDLVENLQNQGAGSNDYGKVREVLDALSMRWGAWQDFPESDNFTLKLKSHKTKEIHKLNLPWTVYKLPFCLETVDFILESRRNSSNSTQANLMSTMAKFQSANQKLFSFANGKPEPLKQSVSIKYPSLKDFVSLPNVLRDSKSSRSKSQALYRLKSERPNYFIKRQFAMGRARFPLIDTAEPSKITWIVMKTKLTKR